MKPNSQQIRSETVLEGLLPALVILLGLQMLRSIIPGLAWYLKDTRGASTLDLLPYAFGTFFLGFLAAPLVRLLGGRLAIWITAGGLAVLRIIEQISFSPGLDFYLAIAGTGLFLNFLPIYIGWRRESPEPETALWTYGLVVGFALDITLRGVFGFRDLSTIHGWAALIVVCALSALILWRLWMEARPGPILVGEARCKGSALLLAVGPFFVLQMLFLQSPGWLEEVAGLGFPGGFILVGVGFAVAALGLALGFARPLRQHPSLALGLGLLLVYGTYYADQLGKAAIALILVGQFTLGWGLAAIGSATRQRGRKSLWRTTLFVNSSMLIFLILSFAFYAAQDIALPISRASFPAFAAGLLVAAIIWATFQIRSQPPASGDYSAVLATGILLSIPLMCWAVWGTPVSQPAASGLPVTVMNYNIHSAFDTSGRQDLEAIAQVIERSGADIIGFEEISRTRLMDGGTDMPTWLARRLEMNYLFQGTEEPTWGNAILTRYPILDSGQGTLPREGTLIGRGYLWALLDIGEDDPLLVITTHLHHLEDEGQVRQVQVPVILEFWDGRDPAILLGDFNAEPGSPEMELIAAAGLHDAWGEAGTGPGYTWPAQDPYQRIDWLWLSPSLQALDTEVLQTEASGHRPVIAEITYQ